MSWSASFSPCKICTTVRICSGSVAQDATESDLLRRSELVSENFPRVQFVNWGNHKFKAMISCGGGLLGRASR